MSARKQKTVGGHDVRNYYIYCINIYGSCLNSIKNEFKRQIQSGLRQSVFILDLDDLHNELNNKPRNSKLGKEFFKNRSTSCLMNAVSQRIQDFRKDFKLVKNQISEELNFDLYHYWLEHEDDKMNLKNAESVIDGIASNTPKKVRRKDLKNTKLSKNASNVLSSLANENKKNDQCTIPIVLKEHNQIGKSKNLAKIQCIKDNPNIEKFHIIIIGQMSNNFYLDLLRQGQPLQSILYFVPAECNYDSMVSNTNQRHFIKKTLEDINCSINELRQEAITKPIGIFTYDLPIISTCLATKYARDIVDQITWSVYDIDILQQRYKDYYYTPFQETDIAIPLSVDLKQLNHLAGSLTLTGHFQNLHFPDGVADLAIISTYLESLLRSCVFPDDLIGENEVSSFSVTESSDNHSRHNLSKENKNSFSSITKIPKWERLFVAENNKLLCNILLYADQNVLNDTYLSYLEYDVLKKYVLIPQQRSSASWNTLNFNLKNVAPLQLPKFVKYYANADSYLQRFFELQEDYEDCQVDEIYPGCKLYTFKRTHNEVFKDERMVVLPTRLCFRDFSLFQKNEFLKNLRTPEMCKMERKEEIESFGMDSKLDNVDINRNIFVIPNSLKDRKQQTEGSRESSIRKNDFRTVINSLDAKPSLSRITKFSKEWVGLPPDHNLLKGYNLDDVLQKINIKNKKYYFPNGFVRLQEETFGSHDTNKELVFSINNSTLFFSRPRFENEGLWKNIGLITKNEISLRILNDPKNNSKIVMNYANGLSIHQIDLYCEQIWHCNQTPNKEHRRIFTPYGSIIVFFKSEDMILIMRYNGEVYRLYQNKQTAHEGEKNMSCEFSENLENSSDVLNVLAQEDSLKSTQDVDKLKNIQEKRQNSTVLVSNRKKAKVNVNDEFGNTQVSSSTTSSIMDNLKASIDDELRYLKCISFIYQLNYFNLVITTSRGKRINLTHEGEIFEARHCSVEEWHDYFLNEAYCQRSDGVKMIWTKDNLKCYHKDGSVLTTKTEEVFTDIKDEFEDYISESSSHNMLEVEKYSTVDHFSNYLLSAHVSEEDVTKDACYINYTCSSWLMQHHNYADVKILREKLYASNPSVRIEILGRDDISIHIHSEELPKEREFHCNEAKFDEDYKHKSGVQLIKQEKNTIIGVRIGDKIQMTTDCKGFEISANMDCKKGNANKSECDSLALTLKCTDDLNNMFEYLVNKISSFKQNNVQKTEVVYFMEKIINESTKRGFEFFEILPFLSKYKLEISNCITEAKPIKAINELMKNSFDWYEVDMKKFPRFRKYQHRTISQPEHNFSKLLSCNVYVKIPPLLQNTADISKFLEPFDSIHFKKLRYKFKDLLDFYLKPKFQHDFNLFRSSTNWKKRILQHQKRLRNEQKRIGFYYAMINHKMYPNYWHFKHNNIDIFDFIQNSCKIDKTI